MNDSYLLGATDDDRLMFANILTRTTSTGINQILISLDIVRPFCEEEFDIEVYACDLIDDLSDEEKYQMCVKYNCAPAKLVEPYLYGKGSDPRDYVDCSLYPECYEVNQEFWYFASEGCGQLLDSLSLINRPALNKEFISLIQKIHKECHLKNLDNETFNSYCCALNKFRSIYKDFDEEEWITSYIKDEFYS